MILNRPSYSIAPFRDCEALGWRLSMPAQKLLQIAASADDFYYLAHQIPKSDGSLRDVYAAREPLRTVQKKILDRILRQVYFPGYLMGGIRDPERPRDYVRNAMLHSGAGTLIQEDVSSFYPSTSRVLVASAFRGLFHFPFDVADCLATLCTRNGELVQGASTSTYIANLIMWDREPALEAALRSIGIRYTRYIDDINASCKRILPTTERTAIVQSIYALLRSYGYSPKRAKQAISSTGSPMTIHGLSVHRDNPNLPRDERYRIRAAAFEFVELSRAAPSELATWKKGLSVRSRLANWSRLNKDQAAKLSENVAQAINKIRAHHTHVS